MRGCHGASGTSSVILFFRFNQCYGVLGVLDHLHRTDAMFKRSKAYERHVFLLNLTPLTESIPDSPKNTE